MGGICLLSTASIKGGSLTIHPPSQVKHFDRCDEVSRGEKMSLRGTDPESYITEYTLVYED